MSPNTPSHQHIYQRCVSESTQDSLSIIAQLIQPGQTLLDLGMGAGGLGQYLSQKFALIADGVSLNPAEAQIARQWYRQVQVADLETADLDGLFAGQRYDCIVCADVLEHLRQPETLLAQCKARLQPGGRLIASVPNAAYCGLIAELIQGEFRYRPEGLLDHTHLRFFTRTSLQRFFEENGWNAVTLQTTQRKLLESEFKVAFDSLPPAVARHLLVLPDALSYQFVAVLQASETVESSQASAGVWHNATSIRPADALFSVEVYLSVQQSYNETCKLSVAGRIGDTRQTLTLDIAANAKGYTGIRLDPADRPGFLRLYRLLISIPGNGFIWQWVATGSNFAELGAAHHQQMLLVPPGEWSDSALLVLYGDDPWIELPLNSLALQQISTHGARLEITAGWPMSADYLQASAEINQKISQLQLHNSQLTQITGEMQQKNQSLACIRDENAKLAHQLALLQRTVKSKDLVLEAFREEKLLLLNQLQQIRREQTTSAARIAQLMAHLQGIEQSNVFRITRPLVRMKMRIDHLRGHSKAARPMPITHLLMPQPIAVSPHPVDIIVPVYRGLEDTRCCLESVLAACCNTRWRLVVINDCSPEPDLTQWLRELARRESRIELLENSENLGFVATVNRGMALSVERDVLLLNSDAEVANDWLDRIQRAAYSAPKVASVTPFSNNATICSYPGFCKANQLPAGQSTASLDALFARHLAGQTVQVPTGVGFCMYLRRQSLQEVGLFDVENFGKGYGEENDFCVRAQALGWINLHVLDTFVRHAGGISFGFAKSEREAQAMDTLRRLHPRYEADVMDFVGRDPARPARLTLDIARITATGQPVILNVIHNREGGTLRHIQELAQRLGGLATFLRLTPAPKGVILQLEGPDEAFSLHFTMPQDQHKLVQTLQLLQVGHIHFHHLLGHDPAMADLASQLGISHDFTAHDFFSYCPQISLTDHTDRYCGELGLAQCRQCLQRHPAPGGVGIEQWRERHAPVLSQARYVIAPSLDAARRLERFTPGATIRVVPHSRLEADPVVHPKPCLPALPAQQRLKVAVLGALSRIKGADVLEEVATLAAQRGELVDFHLIGYAYRSLRTQPKARLTVHGSYDDKDLLQLLQWLQPDAIWFPAVWPETYSYTLSAALESGLPIIAPNIGAFAERIQGRDWTWQCDWQQTPDQWIEFFKGIRERHFCCGFGPAVLAPRPGDALPDDQPFSYTESYLDALPRPLAPDAHALAHIQQQLSSNLYWLDTSNPPGSVFKSSTLRTISRLRTSAALSPLARLVPTHLQRRVKSWLGK